MAIKRNSPSSSELTGGELSVDILHTDDSVRQGDGTNLIGPFVSAAGGYAIPTYERNAAHFTDGSQLTQLVDASSNAAEFDDVGGEKALKVSVLSTVAGGGGGTAATDEASFTVGATQGTPVMGAFDDVTPDALAEGELGIARMTSARALHTHITNSSLAVTGTFWQATQPVSGTFWQATQPVSGTVTVTDMAAVKTAVELIDNAISGTEMQVDVITMPTVAVTGTFWQATQPVSGTFWQATQPVSGTVSVTGVATAANQTTIIGHLDGVETLLGTIDADTGGMLTSLQLLDNAISGNEMQVDVITLPNVTVSSMPTTTVTGAVAHDAAASGNPFLGAARASNAAVTAVANADLTYVRSDLQGNQVVTLNGVRSQFGVQATTISASTSETTIVTAGGASNYNDLLSLTITNSSDTALIVTLKDSTGGTTRAIYALSANGGITIPFPHPLVQSGSNANWTLTCGTSVSSIYVSAQYVTRLLGG